MIKKTRLSFSALRVDDKETLSHSNKSSQSPLYRDTGRTSKEQKMEQDTAHKTQDRKRIIKSSTFQYSKKKYGHSRRSHALNDKNQKSASGKIPPTEKDVIRIIPLGGVEEIGKNM